MYLLFYLVASAFLFLLLPDVDQKSDDVISVRSESAKIVKMIKNSDYKYLFMYFYFPGVAIGFYATFLYKLVAYSLPQTPDQTDDDYQKFLNYRNGYVFLALGVSQACVGIFMNRFGEYFCKFKLAVTGTVIIELAGVISLLCYFFRSYPLCFVIAALWGGSDTFLQTNLGAIISSLFPGQVESFSVYRIFFAAGTVTTIVLNLALDSVDYWVFLIIVMSVQMFYTLVSTKVMELKSKIKSSLLDRDQTD
jgi:MFS family permease